MIVERLRKIKNQGGKRVKETRKYKINQVIKQKHEQKM